MENKILKKFEATDVTIEIIDGIPMFELYSTGMALGYVKSNTVKGKKYFQCRKDRVDKTLKNAEIKPLVHDNKKYITINDVRRLITLSHTDNSKKESFINFLKNNEYIDYNEIFTSTRKEIKFLNELEEVLSPIGIKGIRQYPILSYRIDYYIPKLNLAVEYDENDHKDYSFETHELRQKNIENNLNCKFIRLSDSNTNLNNIGIVINEIMSGVQHDCKI